MVGSGGSRGVAACRPHGEAFSAWPVGRGRGAGARPPQAWPDLPSFLSLLSYPGRVAKTAGPELDGAGEPEDDASPPWGQGRGPTNETKEAKKARRPSGPPG